MAQDPTQLPKFEGIEAGQGPSSIYDWIQFWQFLLSLWRKAQASATVPQVKALIPPNPSQGAAATQAAVALAQAQATRPPDPSKRVQPLSNIAMVHPHAHPADHSRDDIEYIALATSIRPPYVSKMSLPVVSGFVYEGTRAERNSYGTGNIAGTTLTAATGPAFTPTYIGKQIAINGGLYTVASFTSGTIIVLSGSPPVGACGWQFMLYPANTIPASSIYCETNSKLLYIVKDSTGTCNTNGNTVTWVSGPKFSPYWAGAGTMITINGVAYLISFTTQTTMTIATSAGIQAGVSWSLAQSSWFYECGIEVTTSTDLLARYSGGLYDIQDDGYTASVYDYNHALNYNGNSNLWAWALGDPGSKWVVASGDGSAPQGGPWQFCDGTNIGTFQIVAGVPQIVNVTTPDLRSDTFIRGGGFTGSTDATTAPSFNPAGLTFTGTAGAVTGTFSGTAGAVTGTFAGTAAILTGSVAAPVFTGSALATHQHAVPIGMNSSNFEINTSYGTTSAGHSGANNVATAAGGALFSDILTSAVSAGTPAGTNTAPALTMNSYTPAGTLSMSNFTPAGTLFMNNFTPAGTITGTAAVGAPTVGAGAPKSIALLFYMRR